MQRKWSLNTASLFFFFFSFSMTSEKLFKTMRQVATGAHPVKGLWLQYHVAGFCCRWCLKWSTFLHRPPSPHLVQGLFLVLNRWVYLLLRRLHYATPLPHDYATTAL